MENMGHDEPFVPPEKVQRVRGLIGRVLPFVDPVIHTNLTPKLSNEFPETFVTEKTTFHQSGRQTVRTILPEYVRKSYFYVPSGEWPSVTEFVPDFETSQEEAAWKDNVMSQAETPRVPPVAEKKE